MLEDRSGTRCSGLWNSFCSLLVRYMGLGKLSASLCLHFLICKVWYEPHKIVIRFKRTNTCKTHGRLLGTKSALNKDQLLVMMTGLQTVLRY